MPGVADTKNGFLTLTDEELAEAAASLRVADPSKDNGAFESIGRDEALKYLAIIGAKRISLAGASDQDILKRLKLAFWDSQRLDNYFPSKSFGSQPKLRPGDLPTWPNWLAKHPELNNGSIGAMKLDGYRDAARLDTYVFRHFSMSAFTQTENMTGAHMNPPSDIRGAWSGARMAMQNVATDITRDGADTPMSVLYVDDPASSCMLIMEILDVKQVPWPEPSKKFLELLKQAQQVKFGTDPNVPLVPMIQTPKMPLIWIRYSYLEGRPKDGSQFTLFLEEKLGKKYPNLNKTKLRAKLQWYMQTGNTMQEDHIRFLARMLAYNSSLVDPDVVDEMQSHWNGVSRDVKAETRLSFFVPALRLRWRALEEIETGIPPIVAPTNCGKCGKKASKMMCASCKATAYCGPDCSKAHWPVHKDECKVSKRLLSDPGSFPADKFYVAARSYSVISLENGFAIAQEDIKYSGTTNVGEAVRDEYAGGRFQVVCVRPPAYSYGDHRHRGTVIFMWDRRRSLLLRTGPGEAEMARAAGGQYSTPFHPEGYKTWMRVATEKGYRGQKIYLWAKRVGDCLELDLKDIPNQSSLTWAD